MIFVTKVNKMEHRFQGKKIFYSVQGSGNALVLLHGFLESSSIWNDLSKELVENHKLITLDLPGHGRSETLGDVHSMELMASVVHSLVEELNLQEIGLLGHSMGGYVALAFAEAYPEKLSQILLLNSSAAADSPERKLNRNRALELIHQEKKGFISSAIPQLFSEDSRKIFEREIQDLITEARQYSSRGIAANILGMRDRKDRTEVLKSFKRPKIVICGEKDPIIPLEHSKSLAIATDTPIEILSGSHMSWLENPLEIVKIVHFIENFGI